MPEVGVPEAARMLGVSPGRVRQVIADGSIAARQVGGRWLIDVASLPSAPRRGRPMSPRIAWALAEMSAGRRAPWLSNEEAYRLRVRRNTLAHDARPELLLRSWLASRADRHQLAAPDPRQLQDDPRLVPSGISDPRSGMSAGHQVEAYVHADAFEDVRADHLLVPADRSRANVWLHAAPLLPERPVPLLLVAADLADHDGPRELGRARELIAALTAENR
ncbi:helix-turn-helix domain-containing protein [Cellulomonas sp. JZ18]|uniref:helix-turn-helix domain-containing protein n=1 Tax=Cellulomonas sp. JZ18 TaxID=2654191 RepID=UPI0012D3C824|nr:helix-turn-helix domain-containing protein [Cellulomonas sp. JZ18]QGQ18497.1 helix-turn-helix domain-containing protein [Cellulomonas sp. JZ18]